MSHLRERSGQTLGRFPQRTIQRIQPRLGSTWSLGRGVGFSTCLNSYFIDFSVIYQILISAKFVVGRIVEFGRLYSNDISTIFLQVSWHFLIELWDLHQLHIVEVLRRSFVLDPAPAVLLDAWLWHPLHILSFVARKALINAKCLKTRTAGVLYIVILSAVLIFDPWTTITGCQFGVNDLSSISST